MKYESLGRITSCWVGQDKQGRYNMEESWQWAQYNLRTRPEWTYSQGAARNSRSSMYKVYMCATLQFIKRKDWNIMFYLHNSLLVPYYFTGPYFVADRLFFCRVKINHNSEMSLFLNLAPLRTLRHRASCFKNSRTVGILRNSV